MAAASHKYEDVDECKNRMATGIEETMTERMDRTKSTILKNLPGMLGTSLATVGIVLIGATLRGEWLMILVHFLKLGYFGDNYSPTINQAAELADKNATDITVPSFLEQYRLQGLPFIWAISVLCTFVSYYGLGGTIQYFYYIKQKSNPGAWKCQPHRFLTPYLEKHEIALGSFNMFIGGSYSAVFACYLLNGGETALYYTFGKYGILWELFSLPALFMIQDATAYYLHSTFHHVHFLYRWVHKWHHRYSSPTAFAAVAMHPLEFIMYQLSLIAPVLIMPCYAGSFLLCIMYVYYYGVMDHSGVMMSAIWPWQPHSIFHDDHHRYFHCNFGFNTLLFDWLHGTLRKKDRYYTEETFGGKGAELPPEQEQKTK